MWALQAVLLFLKLASNEYQMRAPSLFVSIPQEFKGPIGGSDWFLMAKKMTYVSGFDEISWWLVFIPAYLILFRFLLNLLLTKRWDV